ncbi:TorF family putative porin [Massilia frigida]|nr:TorF family putative porin [Massilia frigida]
MKSPSPHSLRSLAMACAAFLGVTLLAMSAHAADAADSGMKVAGQVSVVSDYIWRGFSQTWGKPALQASVTADHASGAYASLFASNISAQYVPNGSLETDLSLGYKASLKGVELDLGGVYAYYPGANFNKASFTPAFDDADPRTLELYASATVAGVNLRAAYIPGAFFGWNVNNSGVNGVFNAEQPQAGLTGDSKGAVNIEGSYTLALKEGWSLQTTIGRQRVPHSRDVNWNYGRVGVTGELGGGWSAGLAASFTSKPKAFRNYGSLTNNGQHISPGKRTAILSLSKTI